MGSIIKHYYIYRIRNEVKEYFVYMSEAQMIQVDIDREKAAKYKYLFDAEQKIKDLFHKRDWSIE